MVNDEAIVWDLQKVRTVAHIGLDACRSMQSDILVGFSSDSQKIVGLVPGEKISLWNIADGALKHSETTDLESLNSVRVNEAGEVEVVPVPGVGPVPWEHAEFQYGTPYAWSTLDKVALMAFSPDGTELRTEVFAPSGNASASDLRDRFAEPNHLLSTRVCRNI